MDLYHSILMSGRGLTPIYSAGVQNCTGVKGEKEIEVFLLERFKRMGLKLPP